MPFAATWVDLEITILSEVSQAEEDKYSTYLWNLTKMIQKNLLIKQKHSDYEIN